MPRLARFAWAVLVGNVGVILWGAYVRATGSGAGCGSHWPMCKGEVIPRSPSVATLIELSHRVTSGVAFAAVLALGALVLWKVPRGDAARTAAVWAMVFMLAEVLIGAAIVLLGHVALDPSVMHGVFAEVHAGNTFLLLGALTLVVHHLGGGAPLRLRGRRPLVSALAQAFAGVALTVGSGAIAALGDTLFPAKSLREGFAEDISPGAHVFLHIRTLHPVFALVAFVLVLNAAVSLRSQESVPADAKRLAAWVMGVIAFQMALGVLNLGLLVPVTTQMLHLASADVLFILLVFLAGTALAEGPAPMPGGTPSHGAAVPQVTA
jgi:heme A synthase